MSKALATKNVAALLLSVVMVFGFTFAFAKPAKADTMSDLQAQIQALLAQVATLQGGSSSTSCTAFTRNHSVGNTGGEVMAIQKFLNSHGFAIAATGAGSPGNETSSFGAKTKAAVMKWQKSAGIAPASGYWGPLTRAKANAMCTGTPSVPGTPGTPAVSGPVSVMMAPVQPSHTLIAGQAAAELGNITFSGNGSVKQLKLMRTGVSTDSALDNVYLYDGNVRVSDSASVVNGVITFNSGNGLFTVAGTKTYSVRADVNSGATVGNTVGFNVWSMTTVGGTEQMVTGVNGPIQFISSLSDAATINITSGATPSAQSINAGTMGYSIWSAPFNVGSHDVNLKAITFRYTGSAAPEALANVKLFIDSVAVNATPMWSSVGGTNRIGFDLSAAPKNLNTGSHQIELRADIVGGSFRSFTVSLENKGDIVAEDAQVPGFNVGVTSLGNSTWANISAGLISVQKGSLTITLDPAFSSVTKVVGGASNVAIASFKFQAYGEDVKVDNLTVLPVFGTIPSAGNSGLKNVTLNANGGSIGNSTATWTSGNILFSLGSSLIIPAGQSVIVTVNADLMTSTSTTYTDGTIKADLVAAASPNYRGLTSSEYSSNGALTSNYKTISSANTTFGVTSGFTAKTVSPNTQAVKIGSFTLQTGSAEGIQVTNIAVGINATAAFPLTNVSNLTVTDASSPIGQPTATNNFSVNYAIPANGSKTVDVYADLSTASGAASTTVTISYRGATSNVNNTTAAVVGPMITVAAGTLGNLTLDSSAPIAQYVVGGTTGYVVGPMKATASASDITIKRVKFAVTGTNGISAVTVGSVTKSVVGSSVDVDGLNIPVALGAGGALLPLSVNFATVNSQTANSNIDVGLKVSEVEYSAGNNTFITTSGLTASSTNTLKLVGTKPVVTVAASPAAGSLTAGLVQIGSVTIAADAAGQVRVASTTFSVTTAGGATISTSTAVLKDNGNPVTQFTCTNSAIGVSSTGSIVCSANGGYDIQAGTSKTFQLFATVGGSLGAANTSSVTSGLTGTSGFQWYDLVGGTGTGTPLDATLIYNFPTNTYSVRN